MTADITKTGGFVLLKNRIGFIFILDSMGSNLDESGGKKINIYGK